MAEHGGDYWEIPYLPLDPADVGRQYEPVVRINSQSGKGGAAFVMEQAFGYRLPKAMHPEFGAAVKHYCDSVGREISPDEVMALFQEEYAEFKGNYTLLRNKFSEEGDPNEEGFVRFAGEIQRGGEPAQTIAGDGNGPIDAFFHALAMVGIQGYRFVDYSEHAVSIGADATGVAYVQLSSPAGKALFGVGLSHNISYAAMKAVLCAINRDLKEQD
jgi:2-isopropylmalate synthase